MGLRFRKSVKICKAVRLNLEKTGTSVMVGGHRYLVDSSNYIETEFRVEPEEVLESGIDNLLFEDFVYAVSI